MQPKNSVIKYYLKRWTIQNRYQYDIHQVFTGNFIWLEATPITKGVTRCADSETELRILLENDAINMNKEQQKVR